MTTTPTRTAAAAISRMPRSVRDEVSRALEEGADWKAVREICAAAGFPGVRAQNVTNYRKGAHRDWLRREERIEALRRDSEATAAVVEHYVRNGGSPAEAGLLSAAEMMSQALAGIGPQTLAGLIATDPKTIFGMTRELARVAELLRAKRADEQAAAGSPAADAAAPEPSPEARAAALKEIFGLPV